MKKLNPYNKKNVHKLQTIIKKFQLIIILEKKYI